jgi:hypothetical protein
MTNENDINLGDIERLINEKNTSLNELAQKNNDIKQRLDLLNIKLIERNNVLIEVMKLLSIAQVTIVDRIENDKDGEKLSLEKIKSISEDIRKDLSTIKRDLRNMIR